MWDGTDPQYFPSPDEAVNRLAVQRLIETGSPALSSGDDPEDLRHPRHWIALDDQAVPAYPPAGYYIMAALALISTVAVLAFSAGAVGALVAGTAMLGARRLGLAMLAPLVAFPATYWLLRPWMNMATFLALVCYAFACWAYWVRHRSVVALGGAAALAGAAAVVRPDLSALVLLVGLGVSLAESRDRRESTRVIALWVIAGAGVVALVCALNWLTTGDPFQAAYEVVDARADATSRKHLMFPFAELQYLFLPNWLPSPENVFRQSVKYWLLMGPAPLLAIAAAASLALTFPGRSRRGLVYAVVAMVVVGYAASRVSPAGFGATTSTPELRHSLVRYWSPVYLIVAILPLVTAMRSTRRGVWMPMVGVLLVLSAGAAYEVTLKQPESMRSIRALQGRSDSFAVKLDRVMPEDALVFTQSMDKVIWSEYEIASLPPPAHIDRAAASIRRALDGGRTVFVVQPGLPMEYRAALSGALRLSGRDLIPAGMHGVYRVGLTGEEEPLSIEPLDVKWTDVEWKPVATSGEAFVLTISIRNNGTEAWPTTGDQPVHLSYHWAQGECDDTRGFEVFDGVRTALPRDLPSGARLRAVPLNVQAPASRGTYCLMLDAVKEGVTWFRSTGSLDQMQTIRVQPAAVAGR